MLKTCDSCGRELQDTWRYCHFCGLSVQNFLELKIGNSADRVVTQSTRKHSWKIKV